MLYITYMFMVETSESWPYDKTKIKQESLPHELEWHVGDISPNDMLDRDSLTVISVFADGHELDHILNTFENLPRVKKVTRAQVWRGDFARFIFDNL